MREPLEASGCVAADEIIQALFPVRWAAYILRQLAGLRRELASCAPTVCFCFHYPAHHYRNAPRLLVRPDAGQLHKRIDQQPAVTVPENSLPQ
jgi:hypothetical protein